MPWRLKILKIPSRLELDSEAAPSCFRQIHGYNFQIFSMTPLVERLKANLSVAGRKSFFFGKWSNFSKNKAFLTKNRAFATRFLLCVPLERWPDDNLFSVGVRPSVYIDFYVPNKPHFSEGTIHINTIELKYYKRFCDLLMPCIMTMWTRPGPNQTLR